MCLAKTHRYLTRVGSGISSTVGAILRVIAQVASGLDTAHPLTDDNGNLFNLVHRDVRT